MVALVTRLCDVTDQQALLATTADAAKSLIAQQVAELIEAGNPRPTVGLVPTMGALHDGHGALFQQARDENDLVVASVFVNPLQFDQPEDYEHYPRDLTADLELITEYGGDIVFAPSTEHMYPGYPAGPHITVSAGQMGQMFEGASRPGHFDGVCTVVAKLWNILMPPSPAVFRSYFGQKDAQQLAIVTRMAKDLNIDVEICPVDLVRAPSGLALSSRNVRLDDHGMEKALGLSKALHYLADQATQGEPLDVSAARDIIRAQENVDLDYLEIVDPETLTPLSDEQLAVPLEREALALVAAWVPPVRLIDNMLLAP
ncbi:pantoate--beta-alanine ligase [Enteractinococcus fodinae]